MTGEAGTQDTDGLKTPRTTLRRKPDRGSHDWETIAAILDEGLICHIAFEADGQPYAIPTIYARDGRTLYIHGSPAGRMLRSLAEGIPMCLTVTLVDGLILARSVFHHSMNYRSVVVPGTATRVDDESEKLHALEVITDHLVPGRWGDARIPNERELKVTLVLRMEIDEASAKVRPGGVADEQEDMGLPVWAGRLPLSLVAGEPETDPEVAPEHGVPPYLRDYKRA
ncbi:MAG TPA: pyridoxamine 5'-phosphate oxidase family protein [Dehalococcoidia bacterium]